LHVVFKPPNGSQDDRIAMVAHLPPGLVERVGDHFKV
jgi:hypothetical protein